MRLQVKCRPPVLILQVLSFVRLLIVSPRLRGQIGLTARLWNGFIKPPSLAFVGVVRGGGMVSFFPELNRKRPPVHLLDFVQSRPLSDCACSRRYLRYGKPLRPFLISPVLCALLLVRHRIGSGLPHWRCAKTRMENAQSQTRMINGFA